MIKFILFSNMFKLINKNIKNATHTAPIDEKSLFVWKVKAVNPPTITTVIIRACNTIILSKNVTVTPTAYAWTTV